MALEPSLMNFILHLVAASFGLCLFFYLASRLTVLAIDWRRWNGGICRANRMPWEPIGTSADGGRGYKAGDQRAWIGWLATRRNRHDTR